jgi:preprotein translocase subunit SecE
MSEDVKVKSKEKKGGLWRGMKSEFKKIVWPDKEAVAKKTTAVIIVTIILGIIIALLDNVVKYGMDRIFTLG